MIICFHLLCISFVKILKRTIDNIIGIRAEKELTDKIKEIALSYDEVKGVHDLTLHNYGPNKIIASLHIEVDDQLKVKDVHRLTKRIEYQTYTNMGVILTIGVYASSDDKISKEMKKFIKEEIKKYSNIINLHGFYIDTDYNTVTFDLIFSFDEKNPNLIANNIKDVLKEKYNKYEFNIIIDSDISD